MRSRTAVHYNIARRIRKEGRDNPMHHSISLSSRKQFIRITKWEGIANGKSPKEDLLEADQGLIRKSSILCPAAQIRESPGVEVKLHKCLNRAPREKSALQEVSPCIKQNWLQLCRCVRPAARKGTISGDQYYKFEQEATYKTRWYQNVSEISQCNPRSDYG